MVPKLPRNVVRKSRQAMIKRAQPSSSESGSSQKKALRGSRVEASSQEISRLEVSLETIFSVDDESEERENWSSHFLTSSEST